MDYSREKYFMACKYLIVHKELISILARIRHDDIVSKGLRSKFRNLPSNCIDS